MPEIGARRVAFGVAAGGTLALARWARSTSASQREKEAPLPGDEVVPDPQWQLTRAVTISRSPQDVWPWLAQMGYPKYRAGWYAPYWLDRVIWRIKDRSAEQIIPDLQALAVGDRIPDSSDWSAFFTVRRLEAGRALVLLSTTHLLPLYKDIRFAWSFVLDDLGDSTRLLMRARVNYEPVWPRALVWLFFRVVMNLGDLLEAGAMLRGVKKRAEGRMAPRRDAAPQPDASVGGAIRASASVDDAAID